MGDDELVLMGEAREVVCRLGDVADLTRRVRGLASS